jgi:hypothetical protein
MPKRTWISTALVMLIMLLLASAARAQQSGGRLYLPLIAGGQPPTGTPDGGQTPVPGATPSPQPTPGPTEDPAAPRALAVGVSLEPGSGVDDIERIAGTGAGWVRSGLTVDWAQLEPQPGQRNWAALAAFEEQLRAASQAGLQVTAAFGGTPDWARAPGASDTCGPLASEALPALAQVLGELAERYSQAPYHLHTWELWDSPDSLACWGQDDPLTGYGGVHYAAMLQAAYPAIRQADPQAEVLVGALELRCAPDAGSPTCAALASFIDSVLFNAGEYLDGIAFQAYDGLALADAAWGSTLQYDNLLWHSAWDSGGPVLQAKAAYLQAALQFAAQERGLRPKALVAHLAELCPCGAEPFPAFEAAKASYLAQSLAAAHASGVQLAIWRSWQGPQHSGLCWPDGSLAPAYDALRTALQPLAGAAYLGPVVAGGSLPDGIRGHRFSKDDQEWLLLWYFHQDYYQQVLSFETTPQAAWDVLGNLLDPALVAVNPDRPVYLQFP